MLPLPGNAVHDRQQDSRKDEGNLNSYAPFELAIACLIDIHKTLQQVDGRNGDDRSQETTRPLEMFGAPDIDAPAVIREMLTLAPQWLRGCGLRNCWFEPTFHKHAGELCHGVQIHTEGPGYDHQTFRPWRLQALVFKAIRRLYPDYPLWRDFAYEYERGRLPIDVINGSPLLREWVDDASAAPQDLDRLALSDEQAWSSQRQQHMRYARI